MRIVLVEPKSPDRHVFSRWKLPRLGLAILGTRLRAAGHDVKIFVEDIAPVDFDAFFAADLVGLSTITSTAPRSYEFARAARKAGIPVVMGGPHVTFLTNEALQNCDYVIRGEADDLIVEFARRIETKESMEGLPSLSWHRGEEVVHNPSATACVDVAALPEPDLALIQGYKDDGVVPVQTSRGCPFDCKFCSVTKMFGREYRFQSTEKVMTQLRRLRNRYVFFYDDNFTANRKRAKDLCRAMIAEDLRLKWSAQVRCDAADDPELMDLMARAGCYYVYIGMESVSPAALKCYNKRQSVEQIEAAIHAFDRHNIRIHGMFIFGADEDTTETVRQTARFARRHQLASAQFMILTPLPGTPVFDEMERDGRLLTHDWSLYDAHRVVFRPKQMTIFELQVETIRAFGTFYSLSAALRRIVRLDWFSLVIKLWGRHAARQSRKRLQEYVEVTRAWTHKKGQNMEYHARRTAEDIKIAIARFDLDGLRRRRQQQQS
jgi:radical SAM superfamily enzyme YgiQ (UPF0313 family)